MKKYWIFMLYVFVLSCQEKAAEEDKENMVQSIDSVAIIKEDVKVPAPLINLEELFNNIDVNKIHGARTSALLSQEEKKWFNSGDENEMWMNFLSFKGQCSSKHYCGKIIFSMIKEFGKLFSSQLFEITTYTNELKISENICIGMDLDSLVKQLNLKSIIKDTNSYYLVDNDVVLFIKSNSENHKVNVIRLGKYDFINNKDTVLLLNNFLKTI